MTAKSQNLGGSSIDLRKFKLIETITNIKNENIISAFEDLLKKMRVADYENSLKPMSEEEYNSKINESFAAYDRGEFSSVEDYLKEIEEEEKF
jgi:hypothetical protein